MSFPGMENNSRGRGEARPSQIPSSATGGLGFVRTAKTHCTVGSASSSGVDSRVAAAQILARWLASGGFPERLIADDVRDHAFVTDLVLTTVRRRRTLEWVLDRYVGKNPGRETYALLLAGLCQLLFLPDMADYAALHATVEAVRRLSPRQTGFANAVFRNVQRDRDRLRAELAATPLAIRESHPDELVDRWTRFFGAEEAERLCAVDNEPATTTLTILPFTDSSRSGFLLGRFAAAGIAARPHPLEAAALVLGHGVRVPDLPGFHEGLYIVQDAAPLAALRLLAPKAGETILDACAAPGGKTLQLAAAVGPQGHIIATDLHEDRLASLRENVARAGFDGRVTVGACNAAEPAALTALFPVRAPDAILVDAPCSNTGVLRRRADARWRFSTKRLDALHRTQTAILGNAAILRPGRIVYSTCSLEPEEDEGVVEDFLAAHPDYRLERSEKLLPDDSPRDGAFAVLLRRI